VKKKTKKLITTKELSKISEMKIDIIARYIRQGLLPYAKQDSKLNRYFKKSEALKRLKEIRRLENEGTTLRDTKLYFDRQNSQNEATVFVPPSKEIEKIVKELGDKVGELMRKGIEEEKEEYSYKAATDKNIEKATKEAEKKIARQKKKEKEQQNLARS